MPRPAIKTVLLLLLVLSCRSLQAAEKLPAAAEWLPSGAVLTVELKDTKPILDLLFDAKTVAAVTALPEFQQVEARPDFRQFRGVVAYLELTLGVEWKAAVRKLISGASFAAYPNNGALIIVEAEDADLLKRLHEIVLQFVKSEAEKAGNARRVLSADYQGVTAWTIGGEDSHAVVGNRLLLSNRPALLKAALDLRATPTGKNLAASASYQAAWKNVEPNAVGLAMLDLDMLQKQLPIRQALAANTNPMASLLFAGMTESLQDAKWLAVGIHLRSQTLALTAITDGKPREGSTATFASPAKSGDGALANVNVPRMIAGLSFYRDLHAFYAQKDKLFPDRTSGLIFFENMMGIFFTGRDLTDEVLAETLPETRVVIAEQQYDPKLGVPRVQIPGFAIVFRLKHPEKFREVAEEAWQKALGLINFTRGQKAQPGLILDRPVHGKTQFTVARFPTPTEKEKEDLDLRFNFRPALAMPGEYLIFSSTEALTRDLIDALQKEGEAPLKPLAGTHTLVELSGSQLASILNANRENMVRQNMLEKGHSQEQAEREIGVMLTLAKLIGKTQLELGTRNGLTRACLEVQFKTP